MKFENLITLRKEANLSQYEMGKILKTTQSNYSRWETGKEYIPLQKLDMFCKYFNVSMNYVLGRAKKREEYQITHFNNKKVGNNIKDLRVQKGDTQKSLAQYLNTSQSTISAYESGKSTILTSFALKIIDKYNCSLDDLCNTKK